MINVLPRRVICLLFVVVPCLMGADGERPLTFMRVHLPPEGLGDIPLGTNRYIPMVASEFEAALSRLGQGRSAAESLWGATPLLDLVRYDARLIDTPARTVLEGEATWTLASGATMPLISLGRLGVQGARMTTAAGTGEATVFGRSDGSLALLTPEPGTYACQWQCPVERDEENRRMITLPLVPALASTIVLRLPVGLVPLVPAATVTPAPEDASGPSSERLWRIDVGPRSAVEIGLETPDAGGQSGPRLISWTSAVIVGQQIRLSMLVEPDSVWQPMATDHAGPAVAVTLTKSPTTIVTGVRLHPPPALTPQPEWQEIEGGKGLRVNLPMSCLGRRQALLVEAVAPLSERENELTLISVLQVAEDLWAGGGMVIETDPSQVIADVAVERAAVVSPEVAQSWRTPPVDTPVGSGVLPARIWIEHQGPRPRVDVAVRRRLADVNVQRVSVVDASPEAVLARTTCDVTVRQGEAFELRGWLTKGWFIDTVELVSAPIRPPLVAPLSDTVNESPDWRVVRQGDRNELRVALTSAVTPSKPIMLRITGHRAGLSAGVPIPAAELDMVEFRGEQTDSILAVRTGAEMTIDIQQQTDPVTMGNPRLAMLLDDAAIRVRLPAGSRGARQVLRLLRRRPPLDVTTDVRLTSRDGRLIESFTFECTPEQNEIDSVVVHFSTVMDDRLEWQLLPPATGSILARRTEVPERRTAGLGEPIADSWVVELTPAVRQPVTIRAACTIAFSGSVPVPLAWIDGATKHRGTVAIREAGRFRPQLINHRLQELPPRDDVADQAYATVAEFSYDIRATVDDLMPAAELVPGGSGSGEDARAWAWREQTLMWCHAAGATEYETRFDIENHGRASVAFTLPPGLELQGAVIDGQLVRCVARGTGGGDVAIELPPGRRSLQLAVRALASDPVQRGIWPVQIEGGSLDIPVLQRDVRVLLAPDVDIAWQPATHRILGGKTAPSGTWLERFFGASWRATAADNPVDEPLMARSSRDTSLEGVGAFREYRLVPIVGRRDGGSLLVIDTSLVRSASIVAGLLALTAAVVLPAAAMWLLVVFAIMAAVGSLWLAMPFDQLGRAVWWAVLGGGMVRLGGLRNLLVPARMVTTAWWVAVIVLVVSPATFADEPADSPLRVFFTPGGAGEKDEPMALVPEPLFQRLVRHESLPVDVRVVACSLSGPSPEVGESTPWRMVIDVDADAGTTLAMNQQAVGGRICDASVGGRPVPISSDERVRIPLVNAGRHRVEFGIEPGRSQRGQIEMLSFVVPVAPNSTMQLPDALGPVADCEMSLDGTVFLPALTVAGESRGLGRFDISRAKVVRVLRSLDSRLQLASTVRSVESRNDLIWGVDACRLTAAFSLNTANEIVRAFVVRVDPGSVCLPENVSWRLEPGQEASVRVVPLGNARYLIERLVPQGGGLTTQLMFQFPFSDPVGVFRIPAAWVENAVSDSRLTQLVPAGELTLDVRLPENATAAQRDAESSLQTIAWRTESVMPRNPGSFQSPMSIPFARGLVTVTRRQADIRATQRLAIEFTDEQIGMLLQARIDASDRPFVDATISLPFDAVIDRVDLQAERFGDPDAGIVRPVDICWSRVAANQMRVVVQRPETGRFRLDVAARVQERASNRGTVAVMRAGIAGTTPLTVGWTSRDGRGVTVLPIFSEAIGEESGGAMAGERVISGTVELLGGEVAIQYERGEVIDLPVAAVDVEPTSAEGMAAFPEQREERVELADVTLVVDQRGRCWGSVRFDVVANGPLLRLALPSGMRLFETLVDGRPASAVPRDDGTWEIPLLTTRWPRSVLAVFAGEMGSQSGDGKPFEIGAPVLQGLACRRMVWAVWTPGARVLRVADPARVVTAAEYEAEQVAAFGRLAPDFAESLTVMKGPGRGRLEEFMTLRGSGELLAAEKPWVPKPGPDRASADLLYAVVEGPMAGDTVRGLTLRVARRADPTVGGRVLATLVLMVGAVVLWKTGRFWPADWTVTVRRWLPAAAAAAGVAWLILLTPAWPGMVFLLVALIDGLPRVSRWWLPSFSDESTVAQFPSPSGVGLADMPSTQQIMLPPR